MTADDRSHQTITDGVVPLDTARDDRIIAALLAGATYAQTAAAAGCSERTVRRRLDDPRFVERLDAERRDIFDKHTSRLLAALPIAVSTLLRVAQDRQAPATAQVQAARTIIDAGRTWHHDSVLAARLTALENALHGTTRGREA